MEVVLLPRQTFSNLPEEKRRKVLQVAMDEFARHTYENASLSEIVNKLNIAKGSMYQYFHDKKDLYKYVVQSAYKHKRNYLLPVWEQNPHNFYQLLSAYYRSSWQYARKHPVHHRIIANFWDSRDEDMRQEILREKHLRNIEFFDQLEQAMARGEVTDELNPEAAWFVYHAVGRALVNNFLEAPTDVPEHEEFINSVLQTVRRGLEPRKGKIQ